MGSYKAKLVKQNIKVLAANSKKTVRKHLNADAMIKLAKKDFKKIPDHRAKNASISLEDTLMSTLAMFLLKDPSLLAFDKRRKEEPENLHSIFGVIDIPCDSQMRTTLDPLDLSTLRAPFCSLISQLQRGKGFEKMTYLGGHYLLSGDGTGFYYSDNVTSEKCLVKKRKNGKKSYYQQMYAAAFVHPDQPEVIPVFPEMITNGDGTKKQDCERNAAHRFFKEFRREHPHMKVIVVEDALASNGPHIQELQRLDLRYILGAKPGDHQFLFEQVDDAEKREEVMEFRHSNPKQPHIEHCYRFINQVPLNKANQDLLVNFLQYWQIDNNQDKTTCFSWVTDLEITEDNVYDIMRAGRARWRIENETFNTLKNQGYNLGHNYGLGKKNLSCVFTIMMMMAFLIDQIQQMSCWLFNEAKAKAGSKRYLWECVRGYFRIYQVDSMETIYRAIGLGHERRQLMEVLQI